MEHYPKLSAEELKQTICKILDDIGLQYSTEVNSPNWQFYYWQGQKSRCCYT